MKEGNDENETSTWQPIGSAVLNVLDVLARQRQLICEAEFRNVLKKKARNTNERRQKVANASRQR